MARTPAWRTSMAAVAVFFAPLAIMAAVYAGQRLWADAARGVVHVGEPRAWELSWFGIPVSGVRVTPAQWLQAHPSALLDLVCGSAYLLFLPVFIALAAWWRFGESRPEGQELMWAMLWLNLAAYAAYLIYPAAPPWYVDRYGLGPAVLNAPPEAGSGVRFDSLVGVHWFADYYGHNTNIFGAIPSLHVGQTFLAAIYAWRFRSLRLFATAFWTLVTFSSVYLNHHYLVDGLAGMAFAASVFLVMTVTRRPPG